MAFLRDDLAQLAAYQSPHPASEAAGGPVGGLEQPVLDPLDTNESPIDLPDDLKAALAAQYQEAIAANRYPDGNHLALKPAIIAYATESGNLVGRAD